MKKKMIQLMPLTQAQKRIWYTELLYPNTTACILSGTLKMQKKIYMDVLQQAFQSVIKENDAFRIKLTLDNGEAKQYVEPYSYRKIKYVDFSENSIRDNVENWLDSYDRIPMELYDSELYEITMFKINDEEYGYHMKIHHIICDGISFAQIVENVNQIYADMIKGTFFGTYKKHSYLDYIQAEEEYEKSLRFQKDRAFWLENFKLLPDLTELKPYNPLLTSTAAERKILEVSVDFYHKVREFCKENKISVFTFFLGAIYMYIYKVTNEKNLIIGTNYANRTTRKEKETVGMFTSTVAVKVSLNPEDEIISFLKQVSKEQMKILRHQKYPYNELIKDIRQIHAMQGLGRLFGISMEYRPLRNMVDLKSNFCGNEVNDLNIHVVERIDEGYLEIYADYRTCLFNEKYIDTLFRHLFVIAEHTLNHPFEKIAELSLISEYETKQLLNEFNNTSSEFPHEKTVYQLFEEQVERNPDAIAVVFEEQRFTYSELNSRSNQLAHFLQKNKVGSETKVGVYLERSLEMIISILGILKAGGAYVPIDPAYPQDRITYILEDSEVPILISKSNIIFNLPKHNRKLVLLDNDWTLITQESKENTISNVTPENLAYIIYTSGSTGKPKGVMVEHRNVVRLFLSTEDWYNFSNQDVWSMFHSFAFDFSVWELWGALFYGGRLVVVPYMVSRSPEAFYELLRKEKVTVLNQTPSAFRQLMQETEKYSSGELALRYIIFGGEALDIASLQPWYERHGDQYPLLVNMYGITETTVHVTYRPLSWEDVRNPQGSIIGMPIPDLDVYVLDQNLKPVPVGVVGEMYIGGSGVTRGYLNRLDLTQERFISNPNSPNSNSRLYKSGDIARYTTNGELEYLGRLDQQVKIRGFRIELGEIESIISAFPLIREVVLTVHEDEDYEKRLVAYIVPVLNQEISINELRSFMKEKLPDYMIPSVFIKLESLPLTTNGKVDRNALPAPNISNFMVESGQVAPRNTLEIELTKMWEELLNINPIGVTDNFFDLGGHSILAVKFMSLIEQKFNKKLPISVLFEGQTIEHLAQLISGDNDFMPTSPLVAINAKGSLPTLYIVHPAMGQVMCFSDLARELGPDQPVYGLQSAGLYGERKPFTCLEEMAAYYVEAIKQNKPKGPYSISGYCVGGIIAYEIAYQLQKQGETVDVLAIIDICPPSEASEGVDDAFIVWFFGDTLLKSFGMKLEQLSIEELRKMNDMEHVQYLVKLCKRADIVNDDFTTEQMESWLHTWKSTLYAVNSYQAKMAPLPITFFQAIDGEYNGMEWSRHTSEKVEVVQVDGDHFTMLRNPHVISLAKGIQQTLKKDTSKGALVK